MRPPTKVAKLTSAGGGTAQIQMTCVVVSSFLSTLLRGRQEQRHFALAEKLLTSRLRLVFLSRGGRRVPPPISSVLSCNHDSFIRTPRSSGRLPTKHSVSVFPPQNDSGSPAQRPCTVTRTSSLRATSDTTSWPVSAPLPPWRERDVRAPPGDGRPRQRRYHIKREWQHGSHFGTKVGDEPHTPRADGHFGVVNRKNQSLSREKCPATMLEVFPRRDSVFRFEFKTIQKVPETSTG
jgi:hypothetical protein